MTSALVLLWVLMGPPLEHGVPKPDAPPERWERFGVFGSEAECVRARDLMRRMTGPEGRYGWEPAYWQEMVRCAASGD